MILSKEASYLVIPLFTVVIGIMSQRFLWPDALPDANPPLSRLGTGWGVPEGKSSGRVGWIMYLLYTIGLTAAFRWWAVNQKIRCTLTNIMDTGPWPLPQPPE